MNQPVEVKYALESSSTKPEVDSQATVWAKIELARHAQRPHTLDYVSRLFTDWVEIHGDRRYGDDAAIVCGMAQYHDEPVIVIGQEKGRDLKERVHRNFGSPHPEGYRKALRAMRLAEKFRRPVFIFIDTAGAYPGQGAEERGQGGSIAENLREMSKLRVPMIATIIGEGGSGGALAVAVLDCVMMLENAIYSVITPEGCASILWRDITKKEEAAQALKVTAQDLNTLHLIDAIVPEPAGGAHLDPDAAAAMLDQALQANLASLKQLSVEALLASRYAKFRRHGQF